MKHALPIPLTIGAVALLASASALGQPAAPRQQAPASSTSTMASPEADNTRMNRRDRNDAAVTPTTQSNESNAVDLVARVRQAITDDDNLSVKAHNVKVVANGGVVTLRGPVSSAQEKAQIERDVSGVRGVTRVDNRLDIDTDSDSD